MPDVDHFRTTLKFSYPIYSVSDNGGYYVIDNSQCRIIAVDSQGKLRFTLDGGLRLQQGFFHAVDIVPLPNGGFYLLNGVPDERCEYFVRESILQYDAQGHLVKILYTIEHELEKKENVLMNHGRIKRLHYNPDSDSLFWFELYNDCIVKGLYKDSEITKTTFQCPPKLVPDRDIADIAMLGEDFVWTRKNGQIVQNFTNLLCDYSSSTLTDNQPIPWELDTDRYGNIYFIDLKGRSVVRISPDKSLKTIFRADNDIYRINVSSDGLIATTTDTAIHLIDTATIDTANPADIVRSHSEVVLTLQTRIVPFLQCFALIVLLSVIPYLVKFVYVFLLGRQFSETLLMSLIVITTVLITALIAFSGTVNKLLQINEEAVYQHISLLALQVADSLDGDQLEQINSVGDYDNENYLLFRKNLDKRFDQNNPQLLGYLYAVYTVKNNRLFAQIYQNTTVNTAFPFNWLDAPEQGYSQVWNGGQFVSASTDIAGDWIYALAPIRNNAGEIVGILEVSREYSSFRNANQQLLQKLFIETGIFLIIAVLVLIELVFTINLIRQRGREQFFLKQKVFEEVESKQFLKNFFGDLSPCYLTRSLAFLYFIADSISLSFLPLMMKSFYQEIPGISESFVLAVPYSVIMLSFGAASILAGYYSTREKLRFIMYAGFFCSAFGFLFAALSFDMLSFTVSQALIGFGGGLTFITIRQIVLLEEDIEKSETGYAHFYAGWTAGVNVGIILGAVIVDHFGYAAAFFTAFGVIILCMLFEQYQLRSYVNDCNRTNESVNKKKSYPLGTFIRLLRDPRVLTLFLGNTIPTYIIIAFTYYYFPIFANRNGAGASTIGCVLLASGLLTVYLGPLLTGIIRRLLTHEQAVYLTAILWAGSTLFFVLTGSYLGAVIVILALGICDGFAEPCLNYYYLSLKGVQEVGKENAIAYYELVSRLGQALGPMIFAAMLILGERTGIGLTALVCMVGTGIIYIVNQQYHKKSSKIDNISWD
ncbi:MAG: MFS transporter [Planctomycetaceae bacterium]|nr:MFS transporter [Planctomycetaceae bacterium]